MSDRHIGAIQRAAFLAHARSASFARRLADLDALLATIDPARAYVSWSGGKDSSVVAHAVHARYPDVPILRADSGVPFDWTADDRRATLLYARVQRWRLRSFWWDKRATLDALNPGAAAHRTMFVSLNTWAAARGRTQRILGLRSLESRGRRIVVATRGCAYTLMDGSDVLLPIARWRTQDVWAYLVMHDLPIHSAYILDGPSARSGTPYDRIGYAGSRLSAEMLPPSQSARA